VDVVEEFVGPAVFYVVEPEEVSMSGEIREKGWEGYFELEVW
jgi:hypothetical protein